VRQSFRPLLPCQATRLWSKASEHSKTCASTSDEGQPYAANTTSSSFRCGSTGTTYADTTVQAGQIYDYIVESVDPSGVESAPSNTISVTIP
jgi:hypothetical protein